MALETTEQTPPLNPSHPRARQAEDFPEAVVDAAAHFLDKPRLRGWIHVYGAAVAIIAGAALVSVSWAVESTRAGRRDVDLHVHDRRDVRRQRHLPPGELEVARRPASG